MEMAQILRLVDCSLCSAFQIDIEHSEFHRWQWQVVYYFYTLTRSVALRKEATVFKMEGGWVVGLESECWKSLSRMTARYLRHNIPRLTVTREYNSAVTDEQICHELRDPSCRCAAR